MWNTDRRITPSQSHGCWGPVSQLYPSIGCHGSPMEASCREVWATESTSRLSKNQDHQHLGRVRGEGRWWSPITVCTNAIGAKTVVQRLFLLAQSLLQKQMSLNTPADLNTPSSEHYNRSDTTTDLNQSDTTNLTLFWTRTQILNTHR